jgi:hypothetical protein
MAHRRIKSTAFDFDTIPIGIGLRLWEEAAGGLRVDIREVRAPGELDYRCGCFLGDVVRFADQPGSDFRFFELAMLGMTVKLERKI